MDPYEETGANSWKGTRVKKGDKYGVVVMDMNAMNNGRNRVLTVEFENNGGTDFITMNNVGPDSADVHQWEFMERNHWIHF